MPKIFKFCVVIFSFSFLVLRSPALALDNPATGSATVTATVPNLLEPDTPVLISPVNNATINTTAPTFIFNPSWGTVYVNHYQLFIDGQLDTNNIPQSTNTIMVNASNSLEEGQHTWMITAIGNNTINRNSATWSFTIDTIAPLILITDVAGQTTSLSSYDLTTIPDGLTFTTAQTQPIISGQSEAGAQINLTLTTAANSVTLTALVGNDKNFSVKPTTALAPGSYLVSASATDLAGNTTVLPDFTLEITAPAGITINLPSPLPAIHLPPLPQPLAQLPQALMAFPIITACSPLIWIIILILIIYILILHLRIRYLKHQKRSI